MGDLDGGPDDGGQDDGREVPGVSREPPKAPPRWIARLAPLPGTDVDDLLRLALGLDVWERHPDALVVAATEERLSDIEGRGLARVERMLTTDEYQRAHSPAQGHTDQGEREP